MRWDGALGNARGSYLDALALQFGVERQRWETDDELRLRVRRFMDTPEFGTHESLLRVVESMSWCYVEIIPGFRYISVRVKSRWWRRLLWWLADRDRRQVRALLEPHVPAGVWLEVL